MDNIKILDNYNYGLLILNKYKVIKTLENIVNRADEISMPIINLLSLYLMDTNNGNGEILTKEELNNVTKLIESYKENPNGKIGIEKNDLLYILNHCRKKRVDKKTNREIALLLAEQNNRLNEDDYTSTVMIDKLIETLDKIN